MSETTIRIEMFEVYEPGFSFPLCVTSDRSEAVRAMRPGDVLIFNHWIREGDRHVG